MQRFVDDFHDVVCWVRITWWGDGYGCGYDFLWTLGDSSALDLLSEDDVHESFSAHLIPEDMRIDCEPGWPRRFCFALRQEGTAPLDRSYADFFYLDRVRRPPLWVKRAFRRYLEMKKCQKNYS